MIWILNSLFLGVSPEYRETATFYFLWSSQLLSVFPRLGLNRKFVVNLIFHTRPLTCSWSKQQMEQTRRKKNFPATLIFTWSYIRQATFGLRRTIIMKVCEESCINDIVAARQSEKNHYLSGFIYATSKENYESCSHIGKTIVELEMGGRADVWICYNRSIIISIHWYSSLAKLTRCCCHPSSSHFTIIKYRNWLKILSLSSNYTHSRVVSMRL